MPKININKGRDEKSENKEYNEEMQDQVNAFFQQLLVSNNEFDPADAFTDIVNYIKQYDRILYAPISNGIFGNYIEEENENGSIGTISSNIISVMRYSQSDEVNTLIENTSSDEAKALKDAQKTVVKIWDHINLAQWQCNLLYHNDRKYVEIIDDRIKPAENKIVKEMNAQVLTLVSMFTALAFLLFGGIGSLQNLFSNSSMPIFKFLAIGSIWSLCLLNLIFVFLYCIGKMTKLSPSLKETTMFKRYSLVWWCDFILCSILILSLWGHYLVKSGNYIWIYNIISLHPLIITGVIFASVVIVFIVFLRKTKKN